jgi:hypothetical protein
MDQWRVTVLGDGGVGKTALAVQVSCPLWPVPVFVSLVHPFLSLSLLSIALLVSHLMPPGGVTATHIPAFHSTLLTTRKQRSVSFI